jgi:hypothetical protein
MESLPQLPSISHETQGFGHRAPKGINVKLPEIYAEPTGNVNDADGTRLYMASTTAEDTMG